MTTDLKAALSELAIEAKIVGLSVRTLRLWAAGKCIGGPEITLGPDTPLLCAVLADYIDLAEKGNTVTVIALNDIESGEPVKITAGVVAEPILYCRDPLCPIKGRHPLHD